MLKSMILAAAVAIGLAAPAAADWNASLVSLGQTTVGTTGQITCPPGGSGGAIWGTGIYTSDSSICMAAVHSGFLPLGAGAVVSYLILPGQAAYPASTRNGVTSLSYGQWSLSFQVVGAAAIGGGGAVRQIDWATTLDSAGVAGQAGTVHQFACAPNQSAAAQVWGSDVYTSDSAICVAAQHRGLIAPGGGGVVNVLVLGHQPAFSASARNGVSSGAYGSWDRSFVFQ